MKTMRRQRGVAVVTALLLTTLAISIVASLFWQQQVQVRSMENQRLHLQTKWILRGALDWATLVLRQDGYDHPNYTSLDQVWATPLAETRLDQYIERERVEGETFDATLSGGITDACSRYNLTNLAQGGRVNTDQVKVFQRLLQNLQLDQGLAERVARIVASAQPKVAGPEGTGGTGGTGGEGTGTGGSGTGGTGGAGGPSGTGGTGGTGGAGGGDTGTGGTGTGDTGTGGVTGATAGSTAITTMKLLEVDDLLAIPGFNQASVDKLRQFVTVLPDVSLVNVNTAPAEVLAAVAQVSVSEANALVVRRKQAPWRQIEQFQTEAHAQDLGNLASVKSEWFLVDTRIKLDRAALNAESLVYRPLGGLIVALSGTAVKWTREY